MHQPFRSKWFKKKWSEGIYPEQGRSAKDFQSKDTGGILKDILIIWIANAPNIFTKQKPENTYSKYVIILKEKIC